MNQNSSITIHLKDWMVISVEDGVVLKYESRDLVWLIEVTSDNDVHILHLDDEADSAFCERDARLIARVIFSIPESSDVDYWDGGSLLLPVSFDDLSIEDLSALAALVYCYHMPQSTRLCGDEEYGFLHHVHFDGKCWIVSIAEELELDFILDI